MLQRHLLTELRLLTLLDAASVFSTTLLPAFLLTGKTSKLNEYDYTLFYNIFVMFVFATLLQSDMGLTLAA